MIKVGLGIDFTSYKPQDFILSLDGVDQQFDAFLCLANLLLHHVIVRAPGLVVIQREVCAFGPSPSNSGEETAIGRADHFSSKSTFPHRI